MRVDGEAWQPATLGPQVSDDYWRQWYFEWDAEPGQHFIACRATNKDGEVQTRRADAPVPRGLERAAGDLGERRLSAPPLRHLRIAPIAGR